MLKQALQFGQVVQLESIARIASPPLSQPLRIEPRAVDKRHHIELHATLEEPPVIGPRLHHQRKAGQLRGTVVDIETEEILLQDQPRDVLAADSHAPDRSL